MRSFTRELLGRRRGGLGIDGRGLNVYGAAPGSALARGSAGGRMTRRSQPEWPPRTPGRRGPRGSFDPFYQFERLARDDGKPYRSPEPKAELHLLAFLGSKAALIVMGCLLVVVVATLLVLMAARL